MRGWAANSPFAPIDINDSATRLYLGRPCRIVLICDKQSAKCGKPNKTHARERGRREASLPASRPTAGRQPHRGETMNKKPKLLVCIAVGAAALSTAVAAGEKEDALIEKVLAAYGGDALTGMKSIAIDETYKNAFPGQGYTPVHVEFTELKQEHRLDPANQRASVESWSANWGFVNHTRQLTAGEDIVTINYRTGDYQTASAPDYYTAFGPVIRTSDTLLAFELARQAETANFEGERNFLGTPHQLISFEIPNSPRLTLYVENESGLISKMVRDTGLGPLTYQFRNHLKAKGVAYASDFEFFINNNVNLLTGRRDVAINTVRGAAFRIDRGITEEPARIDTSEMSVDALGDGVHLVGTGFTFTTFIDAGDHVIAVGGSAGLQERVEAYREATGADKPLRYQIATHHHTDHLDSMPAAFELGANFIAPAAAVENLKAAVGDALSDERITVLDKKLSLGPVDIHEITTSHAQSYALVYVPAIKAVFQADHYNGVYQDAVSPANVGSVSLKDAVDALGLDVAIVLSAHGREATPWADFVEAVEAFDPQPCIRQRAICG